MIIYFFGYLFLWYLGLFSSSRKHLLITLLLLTLLYLNPSTLNDLYSGRTAPLTSKVALYIFIQQILVLNILNMVYTLRFSLFKMQFVS